MNRQEHIHQGVPIAGLKPYQSNHAQVNLAKDGKSVPLAYRLHHELWRQPFTEIANGFLQYQDAINEIAMFRKIKYLYIQ